MKEAKVLTSWLIVVSMFFCLKPLVFAQGEAKASFEITPSASFPIISGDKEKFEEDHWLSRNTSGGIENFSYLKYFANKDRLAMDGRAIAGNNDYAFNLDFAREGVGSLIFEFEEFRKYYDGSGGYSTALPSPLSSSYPRVAELDTDLHLDIGNLKLEGILENEDLPKLTLGYEREYRDGAKSLVSWSSVESGAIDPKSYPTFLELDEIVDSFKIGLAGTIKNVDASLDQTFEHAVMETQKNNNVTIDTAGAITSIRCKYEDLDFDKYTTILRMSKDINDKVFTSFGLLFNHYLGGSIEAVTDTSTSSYNENHPWNPASIEENSVVLMQNFSLKPWKDIFADLGLKAEIINKNGASIYNRDIGTTPNGVIDEQKNIKTNNYEKKLSETIKLKNNRCKNVVFYAEAEFEQDISDLEEHQDSFGIGPAYTTSTSTSENFALAMDLKYYNNDYTLGFKWYPSQKLNLTGEYKNKTDLRDYDHREKTGNAVGGYRAFLDSMDLFSHIPSLKLNYKPLKWASYNLGYIFDSTRYAVRTLASDTTQNARYWAHMYSADVTLTPYDYLYFTLFYQKTNAATKTNTANDYTAVTSMIPAYNANFDTATFTCNYAPTDKTTLKSSYSMYITDNYNNYASTGATVLPLGLKNLGQDLSFGIEHKFNPDRSLEFKYDFMQYDEDSNGGFDDYEAHLIYAGVSIAF